MRKCILVFGGGLLQLSLINQIRKSNFRSVVIDPDNNAPAKNIADYFECVQGDDFNKTCKIIRKYNVKAILTTATDKPLLMMSSIASKFGFISFSEKAAKLSTDKYLMKTAFHKNGIPYAYGELINKESVINHFPCVIKPRDNSGSRGVIFCKNKKEFKNIVKESFRYTNKRTLLMEEYIQGKEYSVESIHYNGNSKVIQITEKQTSELPYNVETAHIQPAGLPGPMVFEIKKMISKIAFALDFSNCASHTELKIRDNRIIIIESSPRLGGDFITSCLVPLSTGINIEKCLLDIVIGNKLYFNKKKNKSAAIKYFNFNQGYVREIKNFKINKNIVNYSLNLKKGSFIPFIRNSIDRYGFFIISARDRKNILSLMDKYTLKIKENIIMQR